MGLFDNLVKTIKDSGIGEELSKVGKDIEKSVNGLGDEIKQNTTVKTPKTIPSDYSHFPAFEGTIRDNIRIGKLDATDEEIEQAVKESYLEEFVNSLDKGLNTQIGERGMLLSGGQKQRIGIARAFLKNAPILVLDEATSALDNQSEHIVQQAIENLMKDRTVFVIAHRLSTMQNADRIAVINNGNITEIGTHDELMSIADGEYKKLYEMQFN